MSRSLVLRLFCFKNLFTTIELLSCIVDNYICLSLVVVVALNEYIIKVFFYAKSQT